MFFLKRLSGSLAFELLSRYQCLHDWLTDFLAFWLSRSWTAFSTSCFLSRLSGSLAFELLSLYQCLHDWLTGFLALWLSRSWTAFLRRIFWDGFLALWLLIYFLHINVSMIGSLAFWLSGSLDLELLFLRRVLFETAFWLSGFWATFLISMSLWLAHWLSSFLAQSYTFVTRLSRVTSKKIWYCQFNNHRNLSRFLTKIRKKCNDLYIIDAISDFL